MDSKINKRQDVASSFPSSHADQVYENILSSAGQSVNDFSIAISAFLSKYPDHARAHNDLGVILYQQGNKKGAVQQYEHAVQLSPNSSIFIKNLADYHFIESKEFEKALWFYQRILSFVSNDVETLINAGTLYVLLQQPQRACLLLQKALLLDPHNQKAIEIIDHIRLTGENNGISTHEPALTRLSSKKRAEPVNLLRSAPSRMGKLVMTLLVRDEEDIVEKNIEFHLSQGVDFIIATDNGSVDGTKDILNTYVRQGKLLLIEEPSQDYAQSDWVNRMAKLAVEEYQANYIVHCDADEFWSAGSRNLKAEIASCKENVLIVPLTNVLLRSRSMQECFPEDSAYAVINPLAANNLELDSALENLYLFEYPPKVIFSTANGLFDVVQGNHDVVENGFVRKGKSIDIRIYHFPVRNYRQFLQKVINGGSSYERNLQLGRSVGFHWRRWFNSYKKGRLDQEYEQLILHDERAENLEQIGVVEHFSFSSLGMSPKQKNRADG